MPKQDSYVVAPGQSLLIRQPAVKGKTPTRKQYLPGESIPAGLLTAEEMKELTEAGKLVKNGVRIMPNGQRRKSPGKWNRDPESLVGKSYNQLAVMIAEIDANEPVPPTKDEAIALLTRDYDIAIDAAANAERAETGGPMVKTHPSLQVANDDDLFPMADEDDS